MPSDTIETILQGIDPEEFVSRYWQKEHLLLRGQAGRFRDLLPMPALNRILAEHSPGGDRLRLFRAGELIPGAQYQSMVEDISGSKLPRVDAGRLVSELKLGAMIGLSQVNELYPSIGRLARTFEYYFRDTVMVNAYVGFAESRGFRVHWDDHEVFILQISGRKLWRIYGKTNPAPMYRELLEYDAPRDKPVWEGTLEDGDLLYLPRGCWHDAEGIDEETIHLSVGVDCSLGVHLVSWLARELRANEFFRLDLPRFGSVGERRDHARRLREILLEHLDDDVVDRYFVAQDASATARAAIGLPASFAPGDSWIRWVPPRPVEIRIEVLGRFVEFDALGRQWILPRASEPLVRLLSEKLELRLSEIRERFSSDIPALDHYLDTWFAQGLIEWTAE